MTPNNVDIYGSLALNLDQSRFKDLVLQAIKKLCKFKRDIHMLRHDENGYLYEDYVITIKVSRDKRCCEVYRNRTGTLVFAMEDMKVIAIGYEYIFLESHLTKKLKEVDG